MKVFHCATARAAFCLLAAVVTGTASQAASVPATFTGTSLTTSTQVGFTRLTSNSPNNIQGDFALQIFDLSATGKVGFRFLNNGPVSSRIEEVYFYDGTLIKDGTYVGPLDNASTTRTNEAAFAQFNDSVRPKDLPGFEPYTKPSYHLTYFYAADAGNNSSGGLGVPVGGYADFTFNLLTGITFQDVVNGVTNTLPPSTDPNAKQVYIGLHVQSIAPTGNSDSFLANGVNGGSTPPPPTAAPLPGVAYSGLALVAGVAGWRRVSGRGTKEQKPNA